MAILGSPWETYSDLNPTDPDALPESSSEMESIGPKINGAGTIGTMGHYCYFNLDNGTDEDYTLPFDFPISGDFTIICNALATDLAGATAMSVSVQGSVDGDNWIDLHDNLINGAAIDDTLAIGIYDYDAKGRMPKMRLGLTPGTGRNETILIAIVPQ